MVEGVSAINTASAAQPPLRRVLGLVFGYIGILALIKLVVITLVAYILVRTADHSQGSLQRMGDLIQANQVIAYGLSAVLFVLCLHFLQPLTTTRIRQVFDLDEFKRHFPGNALNGLVLTLVLILGTSLGGYMSYLGIYIRFDEVVVSLFSSMIFGVSLFLLMIVEEYILRSVLEPAMDRTRGRVTAIAVSTMFYLAIKNLQFDLTWMHVINLILLNVTLSTIARNEKSYMASAAFAGTFMVILHGVFGLPFMEQDIPGLLLLRGTGDTKLGRLLSGGAAGPESSLVLSVLLLCYLYLPRLRTKKFKA